MLALPLHLPTATYGGHLGQLLYSVLILLGSTPSGNRRMSSHRTTSGSCCVCALAERAYRMIFCNTNTPAHASLLWDEREAHGERLRAPLSHWASSKSRDG